jgi:hypothetical protein
MSIFDSITNKMCPRRTGSLMAWKGIVTQPLCYFVSPAKNIEEADEAAPNHRVLCVWYLTDLQPVRFDCVPLPFGCLLPTWIDDWDVLPHILIRLPSDVPLPVRSSPTLVCRSFG